MWAGVIGSSLVSNRVGPYPGEELTALPGSPAGIEYCTTRVCVFILANPW